MKLISLLLLSIFAFNAQAANLEVDNSVQTARVYCGSNTRAHLASGDINRDLTNLEEKFQIVKIGEPVMQPFTSGKHEDKQIAVCVTVILKKK
jgi:hypothetical protein